MTENPPPPPAPPQWGYVQPAPGAPPVFAAPPVGYGATHPSAEPPAAAPATLGASALGVALLAVVGATLLSTITGFAAAEGAMRHAIGVSPEGLENLTDTQLLALLSPVRTLVLWAEIGFWAGTVLGIWALIQGIVAIATRRGRGQGIAAVVIAALGPLAYGVAVGIAVTLGVATGASG